MLECVLFGEREGIYGTQWHSWENVFFWFTKRCLNFLNYRVEVEFQQSKLYLSDGDMLSEDYPEVPPSLVHAAHPERVSSLVFRRGPQFPLIHFLLVCDVGDTAHWFSPYSINSFGSALAHCWIVKINPDSRGLWDDSGFRQRVLFCSWLESCDNGTFGID